MRFERIFAVGADRRYNGTRRSKRCRQNDLDDGCRRICAADVGFDRYSAQGAFNAAKHGGRVSILPQDSELPLEARTRELLVRYARLQGLSRTAAKKSADSLVAAFNLEAHADKRIRSLSHGMRKRVMVAQAFIGEPEIVLLDEPLSGLDPVEASRMRDFIRARRGRQTMVISSHNPRGVYRWRQTRTF